MIKDLNIHTLKTLSSALMCVIMLKGTIHCAVSVHISSIISILTKCVVHYIISDSLQDHLYTEINRFL